MSNITQFTTGGVKSVQSGTASAAGGSVNTAITISSINPAKTVVTLNGGYIHSYDTYACQLPYIVSLTATTLTINGAHFYNGSAWTGQPTSWQVVEYY
jgi:hypothetical protein